jgi:hypothetical protein
MADRPERMTQDQLRHFSIALTAWAVILLQILFWLIGIVCVTSQLIQWFLA